MVDGWSLYRVAVANITPMEDPTRLVWVDADYAARLDLEENSITRVKNVHIFNRLLELDTLVLKQQPVSSGEVVDHAD